MDTAETRALQSGGGLHGGRKGAPGLPEVVYVSAPAIKAGDLIKVKKLVNRMGQNAADPDAWVYRQLGNAIGEDAASVDPQIAEMNAAYRKEVESIKRANDILFGVRKADVTPSVSQQAAAAGRLGRIGDETQAATLREPRLEELKAMGPEYADQLRMVAAKKAMERLRYGEPEVSTSIEKGMGRESGKVIKHGAAAVGGAVGGIPGAVLGYGLGKVAEAPMAARLRLGLPVAEGLAARGGAAPGTFAARLRNPIVDAYEAKRRREEALAAQLQGGP